jgi:hypothetical protein
VREIRVDYPGDGQWIMDRVSGVFSPGYDHSFLALIDGARAGGFALCAYLGNSMTVHMAGDHPRWCSRDLLWMVFDYPFNQLGVGKLLAPVSSALPVALDLDTRAGWEVEATIRDVYAPGVDMIVLGMTRARCRWLALRPSGWQPGKRSAAQEST